MLLWWSLNLSTTGASIGKPIAKPAFVVGYLFKFREGTMNTTFSDKVFRILFAIAFVLGIVWTPGANVKAQSPEGWVMNPANGHYYRLTNNATWQNA